MVHEDEEALCEDQSHSVCVVHFKASAERYYTTQMSVESDLVDNSLTCTLTNAKTSSVLLIKDRAGSQVVIGAGGNS